MHDFSLSRILSPILCDLPWISFLELPDHFGDLICILGQDHLTIAGVSGDSSLLQFFVKPFWMKKYLYLDEVETYPLRFRVR